MCDPTKNRCDDLKDGVKVYGQAQQRVADSTSDKSFIACEKELLFSYAEFLTFINHFERGKIQGKAVLPATTRD